MKKVLLIIATPLFLFLECKKEDTAPITGSDNDLLIKSRELVGIYTMEYEYYDDDRLKLISSFHTNIPDERYTAYTYDTDTTWEHTTYILDTGTYFDSSITYPIGLDSIITHYFEDSINTKFAIKYSDNESCGLLSTKVYFNNDEIYLTLYEYNAENCGYTLYSYHSTIYAGKNVVAMNDNLGYSKIEAYNYYDENNVLLNHSFVSSYRYSDNNYPYQETRIQLNGDTLVILYEYYD